MRLQGRFSFKKNSSEISNYCWKFGFGQPLYWKKVVYLTYFKKFTIKLTLLIAKCCLVSSDFFVNFFPISNEKWAGRRFQLATILIYLKLICFFKVGISLSYAILNAFKTLKESHAIDVLIISDF